MLYTELSRAIVAFVAVVAIGLMNFVCFIATPFTWVSVGNIIAFCLCMVLAVMAGRRVVRKGKSADEFTDCILKGMNAMSDDVTRHGEMLGESDDIDAEIKRMSMN